MEHVLMIVKIVKILYMNIKEDVILIVLKKRVQLFIINISVKIIVQLKINLN